MGRRQPPDIPRDALDALVDEVLLALSPHLSDEPFERQLKIPTGGGSFTPAKQA